MVYKKTLDSKIVLYTDKRGNIELRADIEKDTLWATQAQMARVFETTPQNITIHLNRIYSEGELERSSTCKESLQVQTEGDIKVKHTVIRNFRTSQNEGGRTVRRMVSLYNLDAIIAVGYRVNSKKATQFRIWATRILHEYLVKGFKLDHRTLSTSTTKLEELKEALTLLESGIKGGPLKAKMTVRVTKDLLS